MLLLQQPLHTLLHTPLHPRLLQAGVAAPLVPLDAAGVVVVADAFFFAHS